MAQEIEIISGFIISNRFAEQLEGILDNSEAPDEYATVDQNPIGYMQSLLDLHLKEKANRVYRREQAAKHRRIQDERLAHDPILKVARHKQPKYRGGLVEVYLYGNYMESNHGITDQTPEYPLISEIFGMPHLMVNPSSLTIGSPEKPGTNRDLEGLVKYVPQSIDLDLKTGIVYKH